MNDDTDDEDDDDDTKHHANRDDTLFDSLSSPVMSASRRTAPY